MAVRDRYPGVSRPCKVTARLVRHDQRDWGEGIRQDLSILLVNRQISDEATFELYRCNTWCFERSLHMSRWLGSISPEARKALRAVDFDYGTVATRHEKTIAKFLSESTYLRSLTIGPYTGFDRRRVIRWAPLWRALYARAGSVDSLIKCVNFRTTCRHCVERSQSDIPCVHKVVARLSGESEFRAELTKLLMDEPAKTARGRQRMEITALQKARH